MEINTITDSTWYLGGTQRSPSNARGRVEETPSC